VSSVGVLHILSPPLSLINSKLHSETLIKDQTLTADIAKDHLEQLEVALLNAQVAAKDLVGTTFDVADVQNTLELLSKGLKVCRVTSISTQFPNY